MSSSLSSRPQLDPPRFDRGSGTRLVDRWDALSLALLVGTVAVTATIYARLPAVVPTHFDLSGRANGFSSRAFGAAFLPVVAALTWALVRFGARIAPGFREKMERSPMSLVGLLTVAFLVALHFVMLAAALRGAASVGAPLGVAFGAFFLLLGQVLPRVRRNPFVGVRTAWTLTSDENWARTHRFAGRTFTAGGLVAMAASLAGAGAFGIVVVVAAAAAPAIYSWIMARRLPPQA